MSEHPISEALKEKYIGKMLIDSFYTYYLKDLFGLLWEHYSKFSQEEKKKNPKITVTVQEYEALNLDNLKSEDEILFLFNEVFPITIACVNYFCISESPKTPNTLGRVTFKPLFEHFAIRNDNNFFTIRFDKEYNKGVMVNATKNPFLFADSEEVLDELGFPHQEDYEE